MILQTRSLLILALLASATSSAAMVSDPPGDVAFHMANGEVLPVPEGARDLVDLLELSISETDDSFVLTVDVVGYAPEQEPDGATIHAGFTLRDTEFRASVDIPAAGPFYRDDGVSLQRRAVGATVWGESQAITATVTPGSPGQIEAVLPREFVTDSLGQPAYRDDVLHSFWAFAQDHATQSTLVSAVGANLLGDTVDAMPDDGAEGSYTVQSGDPPVSGLGFYSREPYRSSNGERGVILFDAWVVNQGSEAREVTFSPEGIPENWGIQVLVPVTHLEPGEEKRVPVMVDIPFAHAHGTVETFKVVMEEIDGNLESTLEFGVNFLPIPQPAGHHPTMWMHPRFQEADNAGLHPSKNTAPFLSTIQEDDRRGGDLLSPTYRDQAQVVGSLGWCIPLSPELEIGLDFVEGTADIDIELTSELEVSGELSGQLVLTTTVDHAGFTEDTPCSGTGALPITSRESVQVTASGGSASSVHLELNPEVDLVPFRKGQNLVVHFHLDLDSPIVSPSIDVPHIIAGGSLYLPLTEYVEQPPSVQGETNPLTLSESSLARRPGTTAVVDVTVQSGTGYSASLIGSNNEWASVWSDGAITGGQPFAVIVEIPEDAENGDAADLVLRLEDNAGNLILGRILVAVQDDASLPDDSANAQALNGIGKGTPAPGTALLLILITSAVLFVRRRDRNF